MILFKDLCHFFEYVARPVIPQRVRRIGNVRYFLVLFIVSLVLDFLLDYVASCNYLLDMLQIVNKDSMSEDIYREGLIFSIIVVGLVVPLIEELIQRYYLTSFFWNYVLLPLCLCFIVIELFHIRDIAWLSIIIANSLVFSVVVYQVISRSGKYKILLLKFYRNHFYIFFYVSAITFGVAHIGNTKIGHFVPVIPVFLVLPQIFGGLVLGYIRIRMGLRWSIAFHSLHNLISVAFLFGTHPR